MLTTNSLLLIADEEELFNPECPIRILLEDVKKRCNCVERGQ